MLQTITRYVRKPSARRAVAPFLRHVVFIGALTIGAASHAQHAAFEIKPIARMGETLPGSNQPLWSFHPPIINNAGQVASFTSSGPMLYTDGVAAIVPLHVPGYWPNYREDTLLLNNAGQMTVVFRAFGWPDDPLNGDWLIFYDGTETHVLMKTTDPTPSGDGTLKDASDPSINDAGQVAFTATILLNGSGETRTGLFVATPDGLTEIARTQAPAPKGGGTTIGQLRFHCIDEDGRVTFIYRVGSSTDAIARGDGGSLELLLAPGKAAPGGGAITTITTAPAFNRHGHVLFRTVVQDTPESYWGLFHLDDDGLHRIARQGDPTPDGSTILYGFTPASLDDDGRAVFHSSIGTFAGGSGAYRYDGKNLHTVAQGGNLVPGYAFWNYFTLINKVVPANDLQQAAITWKQTWFGPEMGLWARDALDDLHPVIELGRFYDFAPGESYRALAVTTRSHGTKLANGTRVINNQREICFRLEFEHGGLTGIYVARLDPADCNHNGIPDALEIAENPTLDANGDGVLDSCQYSCPADITGPHGWPDWHVDGADLLALLSQWGSCWDCTADLNGDGVVDGADLMILLSDWGPCDV